MACTREFNLLVETVPKDSAAPHDDAGLVAVVWATGTGQNDLCRLPRRCRNRRGAHTVVRWARRGLHAGHAVKAPEAGALRMAGPVARFVMCRRSEVGRTGFASNASRRRRVS